MQPYYSDEPIERKEYDTKFVADILQCNVSREVELARVKHIGVRSKNKDRAIKVTCISPEQKCEVMRKIANLNIYFSGFGARTF